VDGWCFKSKKKSSFLKKRSKKLLFLGAAARSRPWPRSWNLRRHKSLLVLFFRKELLADSKSRARAKVALAGEAANP
jgi:hypothetical protein